MTKTKSLEPKAGAAPPIQRDPYDECLDLETAGELMNARVGRIMRAIYAEEAKPEPCEKVLCTLRESKAAVAQDRHAMRGNKPKTVTAMIEKYARLKDAEPSVYE